MPRIARWAAVGALGACLAAPTAAPVAGFTPAIIAGYSMEPTYQKGDVIWTRPTGTVRVGDVVRVHGDQTDASDLRGFVHRVVDVRSPATPGAPARVVTQGDGNMDRDPGSTPVTALDGVVVAHLGGSPATVWRFGTTWPARAALAIAMVMLWPTGRRRSQKPSREAVLRRTGHTAAVRHDERERAGDAVGQVGVRRRDLRGA